MGQQKKHKNIKKRRPKKILLILLVELIILLGLLGAYQLFWRNTDETTPIDNPNTQETKEPKEEIKEKLTPQQLEALREQERLMKEEQERQELIEQANRLALGYDYDAAIELLKSFEGPEGGYEVYKSLTAAIEDLEATKKSLVLYGGSYDSVTQFNHIFFHSLIADNSKAFDGDYKETGYNMYMTTISEFEKMMQKMYEDGYVLVRMQDIAKQITLEDGTTKFVEGEIYLPKGKKPFVLSQDDVNYYEYMDKDGFASRIVIGEDGKPTCEMILEDGTVERGPYDIVPILDAFVEKHPDFSYRGAKGILAITGYEGVLGYRTNDSGSPTYEEDKEAVRKVAEALRANGWEFASHSWGHKNMQTVSMNIFKTDTKKWADEVGALIGPTDIYIFPFGVDIEVTLGLYSSERYQVLKEYGFHYFCGVYKEPWMHIKNDYVRMTRRPLDGQAMIQFPERLTDLFNVEEIIDPDRPERKW